jgi:hypothetical protein
MHRPEAESEQVPMLRFNGGAVCVTVMMLELMVALRMGLPEHLERMD